jgi:hypothetical protein
MNDRKNLEQRLEDVLSKLWRVRIARDLERKQAEAAAMEAARRERDLRKEIQDLKSKGKSA